MKKIKAQKFTSFTLAVVMMFGLFAGVPNSSLKVSASTGLTSAEFTDIIMPPKEANGFIAPIEPIPSGVAVIHIKTAEELAAIGGAQSGGKYYILDNDINLTEEWTPISDFRGTLDGRGYSINNLYILSTSYIEYWTDGGLFARISSDAAVKNLAVNIDAKGINCANYPSYAGGIVGYISGTGNVTVTNCYVTGNISASWTSMSAHVYAGGIIGFSESQGSISITDCYATGNISASAEAPSMPGFGTSSRSYAGGIIGSTWDSESISITNCYSEGDIYSASVTPVGTYNCSAYAGGIAGDISSRGSLSITDCYVSGGVSAYVYPWGSAYAGGIAANMAAGSITNCGVTGNVSAEGVLNASAGGLVSYLNIGGFVKNCYSSGSVFAESGGADAGGLIASNYGEIINCYAAGDVSAVASSDSSYSGARAGGLVAYTYKGDVEYGAKDYVVSITGSYAAGNVSATYTATSPAYSTSAIAGGLVGDYSSRNRIPVISCYAKGNVSAASDLSTATFAGGLVVTTNSFNKYINDCYRLDTQKINRLTLGGSIIGNATDISGNTMTASEMRSASFYTNTIGMTAGIDPSTGQSTGVAGFDFRPARQTKNPILVDENGIILPGQEPYIDDSEEPILPSGNIKIEIKTPSPGAMNVGKNPTIGIFFDRLVTTANSDIFEQIKIKRYSDDQVMPFTYTIESDSISNASHTFITLTLPQGSDLDYNTKYYVHIPADFIYDINDTELYFEGITSKDAWSFTTMKDPGAGANNYIDAHLNFVNTDTFYKKLKEPDGGYAEILKDGILKNGLGAVNSIWDFIVKAENLASFDFSNANDYDFILAQLLMNNETSNMLANTMEEHFLLEVKNLVMIVIDTINLPKDVAEAAIESIKSAKHFSDITKSAELKRLENYITVTEVYEHISAIGSFIDIGQKTFSNYMEVIEFTAMGEAYIKTSDEFRTILNYAEKKLTDKYNQVLDGNLADGKLLAKAIVSFVNEMDKYKYDSANIVANKFKMMNYKNIGIVLGVAAQEIADKSVYVKLIRAALTLGVNVFNMILKNDEQAYSTRILIKNGRFAELMREVMGDYESELKRKKTLESAMEFDQAFRIYKNLQILSLETAMHYEEILTGGWINRPAHLNNIDKLSHYKLLCQQFYCHDSSIVANQVIKINCPVDVYLYDKQTPSNLKASIINNIGVSYTDYIIISVIGDSKEIYILDNSEYNIEITGNDAGTFSYTIAFYDDNNEEVKRIVLHDIPVSKDETFTGSFQSDYDTAEKYALTDETNTPFLPNQYDSTTSIQVADIIVSADSGGYIYGRSGSYKVGDSVLLVAEPLDGCIFGGWYENGSKVSSTLAYNFTVTTNRTLKAKFIANEKYNSFFKNDNVSDYTFTKGNDGKDYIVGGITTGMMVADLELADDVEVYNGSTTVTEELGTGMVIGKGDVFVTIVIKGDMNGNGKSDIDDAQIFLEMLVGNKPLEVAYELAAEYESELSAIRNLRKFLNDVMTQ